MFHGSPLYFLTFLGRGRVVTGVVVWQPTVRCQCFLLTVSSVEICWREQDKEKCMLPLLLLFLSWTEIVYQSFYITQTFRSYSESFNIINSLLKDTVANGVLSEVPSRWDDLGRTTKIKDRIISDTRGPGTVHRVPEVKHSRIQWKTFLFLDRRPREPYVQLEHRCPCSPKVETIRVNSEMNHFYERIINSKNKLINSHSLTVYVGFLYM